LAPGGLAATNNMEAVAKSKIIQKEKSKTFHFTVGSKRSTIWRSGFTACSQLDVTDWQSDTIVHILTIPLISVVKHRSVLRPRDLDESVPMKFLNEFQKRNKIAAQITGTDLLAHCV